MDLPLTLLRTTVDPALFDRAVWSRVFNHRRDHSRIPFAVCHPRSTADVVAAVKLANTHSKRISIRSGGHSWAAWSVRHDAVLIDLVGLNGMGIAYDDETRVVSVPPATTGRELNDFLAGHGRMFAGGHCPDVGMGGFLLQGGMGWNAKNWGWACESLVSIDVVTAAGNAIACSTTSHPDLFFAARGAGPAFPAIVTRFHLLTRPLDQLFQSLYFFPLSDFKVILQWLIDISPTASPTLEIAFVTSHFPLPSSPTPTPLVLANFLSFAPSLSIAESALHQIHTSLPPSCTPSHTVFCQPTTLAEQYASQTAANPQGHRYRSDNVYFNHGSEDNDSEVIDLLEPIFTALPTEKSSALWFSMAPTSRRALGDMALSVQGDGYVALYAVNEGEEEEERCERWVKGAMEAWEGRSLGSYLGDADFKERRGTWTWSAEAERRVSEARRKWDREGRVCGILGLAEEVM